MLEHGIRASMINRELRKIWTWWRHCDAWLRFTAAGACGVHEGLLAVVLTETCLKIRRMSSLEWSSSLVMAGLLVLVQLVWQWDSGTRHGCSWFTEDLMARLLLSFGTGQWLREEQQRWQGTGVNRGGSDKVHGRKRTQSSHPFSLLLFLRDCWECFSRNLHRLLLLSSSPQFPKSALPTFVFSYMC